MTVASELSALVGKLKRKSQQQNIPLKIEYDSAWPSPCCREGEEGELVEWAPVPQQGNLNFANVETALEISLHPDYCAYFTAFFSHNIVAGAERGGCELLQVWNEDDFERLQQNLIGHILMKRRLKQAPTLFFALTDEDDFILSIDNESGEVLLEQVGKPPSEVIANDLASFLQSLEPELR